MGTRKFANIYDVIFTILLMIYTYYSYMSQFLYSGVGGANIWLMMALMMARVGASTEFLYVSEAPGRVYMSMK